MKRTLLLLAAGASLTARGDAQGVTVGTSRWLSSPMISEYHVGLDGFKFGPLSYRPTVQYLTQGGTSNALWAGGAGDVILRATPQARPYLIAGGGLGLSRADSGAIGPSVGAWGGLGAELFALGPIALQAEALYTWRSRMHVRSVSLGLRLGSRIGREGVPSRSDASLPPAVLPSSAAQDEETIRRATSAPAGEGAINLNTATVTGSIAATALSAMGTPYRWGGTTTDGFDCSGLIQYAYAQHGITLPRRSVEQAQAGREIGRNANALVAGDILTFAADPGGTVAHVGLYLGDGKFIHSANGGVQTSRLAADDPAGGWWYTRWIGARRIIDQ